MITRHFIDVPTPAGARRVHYRRAGNGPPLLMVHQSPRSSAEFIALMTAWSAHFTCIAPDTPGFGESDPLPGAPDIDDFADAIAGLLDALGLAQVAAYGFHSGGIILVTALRRHPQRFSALAVGGYAVWTPQERAIFGDRYLPPFVPDDYGAHLTWLWNRVLEQTWFFPWFDVRDASRLSVAHADPARADETVQDMLASGDAYRAGYGAVLRAPRDIPPSDAVMPPVLITAYDGDPLQPHIDRLGAMPANWLAQKVATPAAHHAASLDFLRAHPAPPLPALPASAHAGFVRVTTADFDGLVHWQGPRGADQLHLHAPGRSAALGDPARLRIDLPGHGLSDDWAGAAPVDWAPWRAVIDAAAAALGATGIVDEPLPVGAPELLFPDLSPDRFGAYLTTAWSIVRAGHFFAPWYAADAAHAVPFDAAAITPDRLAVETRALLQARSARALLLARRSSQGDNHGTA